jgi:hypothetical protein
VRPRRATRFRHPIPGFILRSLPGLTRQSMTLKSEVNATLRSVVGKQNVGANPSYELTARKAMNKPMPNVETWTAFAVSLRRVGLELFGSRKITVTEHGAADLKVLGLLLLARTLSNLKATWSLVRKSD